ncbi:MAG: DNA internalization-related competence protein ComEC/Rec2 [Planctomycetes bacterium]|nr:DNA internalization-related competence protein ComEC/Rec2 [Planctomycetota bacterium]
MDEIRQKLALLDEQLTSRKDSFKKIAATAPLLFAATGLIAGIIIQNAFPLPPIASLISLLISAVLCITIYKNKQTDSNALIFLSCAAVICFASLGSIRLTGYKQLSPNNISNFILDSEQSRLATIRGSLITEPYTAKNERWHFAKFAYTGAYSSFYLKLGEIKTTTGWQRATGKIRVYISEPTLDLEVGDYIQADCWLGRFKKATNPGQFDVAEYLANRNIFITASVKSRGNIELLEVHPAGLFIRLKTKLKQIATEALLDSSPPQESSYGLLNALLLGNRGNIDSETYKSFQKTGLLHFISLSGMHLAIFVGIIWWLCKSIGLLKPARAVIIFLLVVPPRAPTLRAAIIAFVFCVSLLFRRSSNSLNTLSLAAIILLLIQPTGLFTAGWQLSFTAVLGIILFTNRIHFFLYEKIANLSFGKTTKPFFRIAAKSGVYLLQLFSVGIAAWLAGAGILLYHFYTINPLTCLWTVIAFPFVAVILTVGYLKIVLSFLLPTVSLMLSFVAAALADWLIWLVKFISDLDISQILIGHVPIMLIVFYYCFIFFAGFIYFRNHRLKKVICIAACLLIIVFLTGLKWQRTHPKDLTITALDVGHGQAILVEFPGRTKILFDAGSLHRHNVGSKIISPFLDYKGIGKIDSKIISHGDVDHINAIPEVVENCKVDSIYANEGFLSELKENPRNTVKFLTDFLFQRGLGIQPLADGFNLYSNTDIKFLWPNKKFLKDIAELSNNNKSLVSLIEFSGVKVLLCSDIEYFAQEKLFEIHPDLKADIVVVPHHGSAKTLSEDFITKLNAKILISSCGRGNYQKCLLTPGINKTKSFYTAGDGAISICINRDSRVKSSAYIF